MVAIKNPILLWATVATLASAYPGQEQGWQGSGGVGHPGGMNHGGDNSGGSGSGYGGQEHGGGIQGGQGRGGQGYGGQVWKDHDGPQDGSMQGHGGQGQGNNKANHARDEDFMHKNANPGDWFKKGHDHDNRPRDSHSSGHDGQHERGGEISGPGREHQGHGFGNGNGPRDFQHGEHGEYARHGQDHGDHGGHEGGFPRHVRTRATEVGVYECSHQNWVMPCKWTPLRDGQCYNRIYDSNGSMGPDKGLTCTVYEQKNCNDNGWNTAPGWKYPGTANYHTSQFLEDHGMLGNGIISIKCKRG
ncbi:hypothetical protein PV08_02004 [Exophiala spinifera]|uniref:Uncharacterized protein n=1 Tax=Exophiala spinifera TaxID=91928 RepID=A0A0D2CD38_9EURO|nr:uncharacterized protein PV08_02004 [Exophiala spinifera]KIW21424.1 hypothetical protein PV08_02004 [Exophiala spinifera]